MRSTPWPATAARETTKPAKESRLSFWSRWMESEMIQRIYWSSEPPTSPGTSILPSDEDSNAESTSLFPNWKPDTFSSRNYAKRHQTLWPTTNSETSPNAAKGIFLLIQLLRIRYQHFGQGRSILTLENKPKSQKIQKDQERKRPRGMAASPSLRKHPRRSIFLGKTDRSLRKISPSRPRIRIFELI